MVTIRPNYEKRTLLVDIEVPDGVYEKVKEYSEVNGFNPKQEFHITLVGFKLGQELQQQSEEIFRKIVEKAESFDWEIEYTDKYYHVKKQYQFSGGRTEDRESLIVVIFPRDLEVFWKQVEELLGKKYSIPFPHVTLASKSSNPQNKTMGIGVQTFEEFQELEHQKISV